MQSTRTRTIPAQNDETYFDKPRIIHHTKTILAKLRRKKILVDDIVAQMNKQHIPMTRARFEDLFTSRPQRVTIATPATVVAFVNVCFGFDAQVLSAPELIDFADAARLPLSLYDQLAQHFSAAEWQEAWYAIVPSAQTPLNRHALVHRAGTFDRLFAALCEDRTVIISGPPGIGKTALARALTIEKEMLTRQRIPFVTCDGPIPAMGALVSAIAQAANIKPLHNEPIELRMESLLPKNRITYIVIDNLADTATDQSIINAFLMRFPAVRLILTVSSETKSTLDLPAEQLRSALREHLQPLEDSTLHAPAMVLFIQTLHALGTRYENADIEAIHAVCRTARGNPSEIKRLAQLFHAKHTYADTTQQQPSLDTLSMPQLSIFAFLATFTQPVSLQLLRLAFHGQLDETQCGAALETLVALSLVEHFYSDQRHGYHVPLHVRNWYASQQHVVAQREFHINRITKIAAARQMSRYDALSRNDALAVVTLLAQSAHNTPQLVHEVARCLTQWLDIWLYHDVSSHVIVLSEEILTANHVVHLVLTELALSTARIYLSRGQADHAQRLVNAVEPIVSATHYSATWAKNECVRAQIALQTTAFTQSDALAVIAQTLVTAHEHFDVHNHPDWYRYAVQLRIDHAVHTRDLTAAIAICSSALAQLNHNPITIDAVMLQLQHSLLHLYDGSLDVAAALLTTLADHLRANTESYYHAIIHLRLAAIAALQHDLDRAEPALSQSYGALERVGSLTEILLVADIYCLILLRRGNTACALHVHAMCDHIRAARQLPRMHYLEELVARVTAHIPHEQRAAVDVPDTTTIYDVMALLRNVQTGAGT